MKKYFFIVALFSIILFACSNETPQLLEGGLYIPDNVDGNSVTFNMSSAPSSNVFIIRMNVDGLSRHELFEKVKKHMLSAGYEEYEVMKKVISEYNDDISKKFEKGSVGEKVVREMAANILYLKKESLLVVADVTPTPVANDPDYQAKLTDGERKCMQTITYTVLLDPNAPMTAEELKSLINK